MRIQYCIPLLLSIFIAAGAATSQDDATQQLTIYAATSLTNVFEEMRDAFQAIHNEAEIHLNFASSSTLAAQLLQGAPADIFASANELQMEIVVENERIDHEDVKIFAHNQLVLIVPADNQAAIVSIEDLANGPVLLVLAARGTPIRAYTAAMFTSHNEEYGEDFRDRVMRNLASEESNVRQVVTRVALGEADAGIVYQSDVIGNVQDKLITILIDDSHNQLASYPIAPLKDSQQASLASEFIEFVSSAEAREILTDNGFCAPVILDEVLPTDAMPEPTPDAADDSEAETDICATPSAPDG